MLTADSRARSMTRSAAAFSSSRPERRARRRERVATTFELDDCVGRRASVLAAGKRDGQTARGGTARAGRASRRSGAARSGKQTNTGGLRLRGPGPFVRWLSMAALRTYLDDLKTIHSTGE